jgi:Icc-related predicted phosphoesterase
LRIVCISDTHFGHQHFKIPEGDILLHAGDLSKRGRVTEISAFNDWLGELPHPHKIIIAGNHDFLFEKEPVIAKSLITNAIYLEDSGVEIKGLKFWGSPVSPWFFDWAFNRERGEDIRKHWEMIPSDTDVLITHGPPLGILDQTIYGKSVGCEELLDIVQKIQPKIHLFGHIHEAYGTHKAGETLFVNASLMNVEYRPVNSPIVVEINNLEVNIVS